MAYRDQKIGLMVGLDPKKAAKEIARALRAGGTEVKAAEKLGCGRRSLQRWIKRLRAAGFSVREAA